MGSERDLTHTKLIFATAIIQTDYSRPLDVVSINYSLQNLPIKNESEGGQGAMGRSEKQGIALR